MSPSHVTTVSISRPPPSLSAAISETTAFFQRYRNKKKFISIVLLYPLLRFRPNKNFRYVVTMLLPVLKYEPVFITFRFIISIRSGPIESRDERNFNWKFIFMTKNINKFLFIKCFTFVIYYSMGYFNWVDWSKQTGFHVNKPN